jgi:hypothetical protein
MLGVLQNKDGMEVHDVLMALMNVGILHTDD